MPGVSKVIANWFSGLVMVGLSVEVDAFHVRDGEKPGVFCNEDGDTGSWDDEEGNDEGACSGGVYCVERADWVDHDAFESIPESDSTESIVVPEATEIRVMIMIQLQ